MKTEVNDSKSFFLRIAQLHASQSFVLASVLRLALFGISLFDNSLRRRYAQLFHTCSEGLKNLFFFDALSSSYA